MFSCFIDKLPLCKASVYCKIQEINANISSWLKTDRKYLEIEYVFFFYFFAVRKRAFTFLSERVWVFETGIQWKLLFGKNSKFGTVIVSSVYNRSKC